MTRQTYLQQVVERISSGETGCILWPGACSDGGYGMAQAIGRRGRTVAHRVVWETVRGSIPANRELDHLCKVRACVNPLHLEPVTRSENIRRSDGFSAVNARKTHCVNGHPFTETNTSAGLNRGRNPRRTCRACHRETQRKYLERQKREAA